MGTIFSAIDRKPEATTGNRSSRHAFYPDDDAADEPMSLQPAQVVARQSFSTVLQFAAMGSGLDDQQLAKRLSVCKGYMSRFLRGVAEAWAKRLVKYMQATHSLAPLQWLAAQVGCEVVQLDVRAAEIAALEARLAEMRRERVA